MRRVVALFMLTVLFCVVLAVDEFVEDYTEDEEMIIALMRQDDSQPEPGNEPSADFHRCTKDAWRMPGQYIVVMKAGTHENQVERTVRRLRAKAAKRGYLIEVMQTYSGILHGFLVKMSRDVLHMAVKLPHVAYIEEDSSIFAQSIPWNLARIIQTKHQTGRYTPPNDGEQVEVFLLDTSVQASHREIEGRVDVTDFNSVPEEDGARVHRQASQCDSHGTHTAGVVSGRDSGVARGASMKSVRVLNCQGKGTVSGALAGLEYTRALLRAQPSTSVIILLPFAGGFSRALNAACREMGRSGAVLIAAAGNYLDDACLYSPASAPEVITVGATDAADQPLRVGTLGTNAGRCVDLFAPGNDIVSASSDCPTCYTTKSGTSQAAAHVAGIAALLLQARPNTTPAEVLQLLRLHAVKQVINQEALAEELRLPTPNMVAALPNPASSSTGEELLCRSVWSERSGTESSDTAVSRCRHGEELLSCSSYAPYGFREGDRVEEREGRKVCIAYNGAGGQGVYAIARCCTGLTAPCHINASPQPGMDAECLSPNILTGCTSHMASDSVRPHHGNQRACLAREGVTSHASCCHAPSLQCQLHAQDPAGISEQVEVSCPDSWTLTGCSALSQGSLTHGAYGRGNTCVVRSSGGGKGAMAVAICCRHSKRQEIPENRHN